MAASEHLFAVVRGWVAGEECPTDTVAFHPQQCAEKYLKAYLAYRGTEFPGIHDIGELIALVMSRFRWPRRNVPSRWLAASAEPSEKTCRPRYLAAGSPDKARA
jgi:HEPN domain-containing protein